MPIIIFRLSKRWTSRTTLSRFIHGRNLITLAIEASCDDTAVAVLEKNGPSANLIFNDRLTSNNSAFKGIHPLVAHESHQERLSLMVQKALNYLPEASSITSTTLARDILHVPDDNGNLKARRKPDFISVTRGPGMRINLTTGLDTAKGLAVAWQIPLVGVHHMQAHALTPRLVSALGSDSSFPCAESKVLPKFPFLSLLVSGGHTLLLHSRDLATHRIIANTDLAVGDCLDKVARAILPSHLLSTTNTTSYGALLEQFAFPSSFSSASSDGAPRNEEDSPGPREGEEEKEEFKGADAASPYGWHFDKPFSNSRGGLKSRVLEFSFTGIGSSAIRIAENGWGFGSGLNDGNRGRVSPTKRTVPMSEDEARHLAIAVMRICFEHLASRVVLALEQELDKAEEEEDEAQNKEPSTTLVLSGGVASNRYLRHVVSTFLAKRGFGHVRILAPPPSLCTDNAAMIAWAGCEMWEAGYPPSPLSIRALRKWSLENLTSPEVEEEAKPFSEN